MAVKIITQTVTGQIRICDFCGTSNARSKICFGCKRDVCPKCGTWLDFEPFTGDTTGDYPPLICEPCEQKLKPFASAAAAIREKYGIEIERIETDFKNACQS